MRASILPLALVLLAAGTISSCERAPPDDARGAGVVEWRVYQDTLERRRVAPVPGADATYRLLRAPGFVRLEPGGRLVTDPDQPMPLGRHRIVVRVAGGGREQRVVLDLHVMPVV